MNDEEYKIKFEDFKNNMNLYKIKHCQIVKLLLLITYITVVIFFFNCGVNYTDNVPLILNKDIMIIISCFLLIVSITFYVYFIKINKEALIFKKYIYTGKISELLDINEYSVQIRKEFLKTVIEVNKGIPSSVICDLYEKIIKGEEKDKNIKELKIKEIIEELK